jgi:hypothetical protein
MTTLTIVREYQGYMLNPVIQVDYRRSYRR